MASTESEIEMHRAASRASCSLPEEAYAYTAAIGPKLHTFTEQRHDAPKSNYPPPNGGPVAWLQVLAGHLVVFNTWGYANSFGIFQAYYASSLSLPASTISWVGSVQVFLIFFIGSVSGRAFDTGYYRPVLWIGCAMQIVAVFVTSLCTKYWQVFLAQGVCQGLGNGLIFCPTIASVSTYFTTIYYLLSVRPYALDNLHVSQATSYSILLIFNAVGIPGRIIPALLADRYFGAITVLIPVIFLAGLSVYIWHSVQSLASDIVWIVFLGFFGASIQGLFPSTLASLTQDLSKSGTRIGCGILFAARVASMGWRWKPAEQ
ncbi:Short-chain dehydrogenase/reductase SDR [Penicillium canescens]|nr:Short-chain dehydrogenase/reductase SDR [Penicillium canescens]